MYKTNAVKALARDVRVRHRRNMTENHVASPPLPAARCTGWLATVDTKW